MEASIACGKLLHPAAGGMDSTTRKCKGIKLLVQVIAAKSIGKVSLIMFYKIFAKSIGIVGTFSRKYWYRYRR